MNRRAKTILLFLVLGAIANVAVAWGCANQRNLSHFYVHVSDDLRWPYQPSGNWPGQPIDYGELHRGGVTWKLWRYFDRSNLAEIVELDAGLPLPTLYSFGIYDSARQSRSWYGSLLPDTPPGVRDRALPLLPLWPGFAINTIFYAAILWLPVAGLGALRRRRRIKRGLCPACAYPVGTNSVCTECGTAVNR